MPFKMHCELHAMMKLMAAATGRVSASQLGLGVNEHEELAGFRSRYDAARNDANRQANAPRWLASLFEFWAVYYPGIWNCWERTTGNDGVWYTCQ